MARQLPGLRIRRSLFARRWQVRPDRLVRKLRPGIIGTRDRALLLVFPGFSEIIAYTCQRCGPAVDRRFAMYDFAGENELDLEALRARLRRMSDRVLLRFGRAARYMCSPAANRETRIQRRNQTSCDGLIRCGETKWFWHTSGD